MLSMSCAILCGSHHWRQALTLPRAITGRAPTRSTGARCTRWETTSRTPTSRSSRASVPYTGIYTIMLLAAGHPSYRHDLHAANYSSSSLTGETMSAFSDHQRIPVFGFGDLKCADREVFPLKAGSRDGVCHGIQEVCHE